MTVISTDGAASLTRSVAANVAQGLQLGRDLTGIDVAGLLRRLGGAAGAQVADNVTHVPISADGDGPATGNGSRTRVRAPLPERLESRRRPVTARSPRRARRGRGSWPSGCPTADPWGR